VLFERLLDPGLRLVGWTDVACSRGLADHVDQFVVEEHLYVPTSRTMRRCKSLQTGAAAKIEHRGRWSAYRVPA
jgi:hypothetical protein